MTANRFATILYRNTSKITLILIYALLEWILIVLLLFNSLFSYLIIKFAQYFGLKPPCTWCTTPDHIFEPAKNIHRKHFCEIHAKEISNLGFCSNHRKLSEFGEMCDDCLSSGPEFTLKCAHKRNLISEDDDDHHHIEEGCDLNKKISDFATDSFNKADDQGPLRAEIEEDVIPNMPTSVASPHNLHEKKDYGTEESLDGSVTSELESGDGIVTVERLKSVLRAEQKALQTLYSELEAERSASAVAANQMIAMMDQLQEEKAAMQTSEYDREDLQLLNELVVDREKAKQELEKELEGVRKKLSDYEDSDGLSVDLNRDAKEEEGFYSKQECSNSKIRVDEVIDMEESLADFEEERLSILVQLKVLEEKLVSLEHEEERRSEGTTPLEDLHKENDIRVDENTCYSDESNEHLLQEILKHLHDLRDVELLERNLSDGANMK
ncbi:myosin-binding protein 2-like [Olea europaea var. sylvestris]|uniref:myosin-binding protein 2-like n=1 Tax=Olea europaea var. sylvestris TaxID=158386 RepID=UPI000C1D28D2|nr:myosin-binding protein 2-like [Olea europaea var. sylvestris]